MNFFHINTNLEDLFLSRSLSLDLDLIRLLLLSLLGRDSFEADRDFERFFFRLVRCLCLLEDLLLLLDRPILEFATQTMKSFKSATIYIRKLEITLICSSIKDFFRT